MNARSGVTGVTATAHADVEDRLRRIRLDESDGRSEQPRVRRDRTTSVGGRMPPDRQPLPG